MILTNFIRYIILLVMTTLSVWAYNDSDLDGVGDEKDLCPRTSFDQIVDHYGCPQRKDITLLVGQDVSSGDYGGTQTVDTRSTSFYAALTRNDWSYALSTSSVQTQTDTTKVSGMGDLYGTVSYTGLSDRKRLISVQAGVKIATANTNIGTGENDYSIRINSVSLNGAYSYLSSLGFTITGDTALQMYHDYVNVSAGMGYQKNEKLYLSGSFNFVSAYIENASASLSASAYMAYTFNDQWFATASYTLGLSDAVADNAVNVSLGLKF